MPVQQQLAANDLLWYIAIGMISGTITLLTLAAIATATVLLYRRHRARKARRHMADEKRPEAANLMSAEEGNHGAPGLVKAQEGEQVANGERNAVVPAP